MPRPNLLLLAVCSGCWVLTDEDLREHDRSLDDPPVVDTTPPLDTGAAGTGETGGPAPIACGQVGYLRGVSFAVGPLPSAITAADLDGDLDADLAVTNFLGGSVTLALGGGGGIFEDPVQLELPLAANFPTPSDLVGGDFTGDAVADLAVADSANAEVWILTVQGGQLVTWETVQGSPGPNALAADLLDGDELADLAAVATPGALDRWFATGEGVLRAASSSMEVGGIPGHVTAGDFDGDGAVDLAVADLATGRIRQWTGDGDGSFVEGPSVATIGHVTGLAAGDLDRDGRADLVASESDGRVEAWLARADGFSAGVSAASGGSPSDVILADLAGDGCLSAVTTNASDGTVAVLAGLGDGTFAPARTLFVGPDAAGVVAAQLDGTGPLDLAAVAGFEVGTVQVFLAEAP